MTLIGRKGLQGCSLPVLITPVVSNESLIEAFSRLRVKVQQHLSTIGGVLLRGFSVLTIDEFQRFASSFGYPLLSYEFASTPRSNLSGGIYSSTEYPAHQHIPLHNEQAYTREWPMKIWFHCVTASPVGGETPIADSRAIYRRMPDHIRNKFEQGLLYVRNYGEFDVPWQTVFGTDSKAEVEAFCRRSNIQYQWKENDGLRTLQLCQGIETHPSTNEKVWFNQAHLFHVSNLQAEVRESLEELLGIDNLPRNVYYADGSEIEDEVLDEVRAIHTEETVIFPWQEGDVMMLDNMLTAHARMPFEGKRKVVVAMAEPYGNLTKSL